MTKLEKQWRVFFGLFGWECKYRPAYRGRLQPTFRVSIPCGHSECYGSHDLYVFVLDVKSVEEFGVTVWDLGDPYHSPHPALFGADPSVTTWEMAHGAGGGVECVANWVRDCKHAWGTARAMAEQL